MKIKNILANIRKLWIFADSLESVVNIEDSLYLKFKQDLITHTNRHQIMCSKNGVTIQKSFMQFTNPNVDISGMLDRALVSNDIHHFVYTPISETLKDHEEEIIATESYANKPDGIFSVAQHFSVDSIILGQLSNNILEKPRKLIE